jgi:hypothetical protein
MCEIARCERERGNADDEGDGIAAGEDGAHSVSERRSGQACPHEAEEDADDVEGPVHFIKVYMRAEGSPLRRAQTR